MRLETFALERFQSIWENRVAWNVSESGVHPLRVVRAGRHDRRSTTRCWSRSWAIRRPTARSSCAKRSRRCIRGRRRITSRSPTAGPKPTASLLMRLVEPGDEIVLMTPNYMQACGPRARPRARPPPVAAAADTGERRTRAAMARRPRRAGSARDAAKTRAILLCNPEQPDRRAARRGDARRDLPRSRRRRRLGHRRRDLSRRGARGGRHADGVGTLRARDRDAAACRRPTGCPGLRIGWVVAPPALVADLWAIHDYTTIAPGGDQRSAGADRARAGAARDAAGADARHHPRQLSARRRLDRAAGRPQPHRARSRRDRVRPPHAIRSARPSSPTRLREERSVLLVPGDYFDMDGYLPDRLRIGSGVPRVGAVA